MSPLSSLILSSTVTVLEPISFFSSIHVCFTYLCAQILNAYILINKDFLKVWLLTYLFEVKSYRDRGWDTERILHSLVHSQDGPNSQGWARLKAGPDLSWISQVNSHLLLLYQAVSRGLDQPQSSWDTKQCPLRFPVLQVIAELLSPNAGP